MTHVHAPVIKTNAEIAQKAKELHLGRALTHGLLTVIAAALVAVGFVLGRSWYIVAFLVFWAIARCVWFGQCVRFGMVKGAKLELVEETE